MTTERPTILGHKKFMHLSIQFLLCSYTGHTTGNTFQQFVKRSCFFELAFQYKNLTGETSHKYFPKYFVMDPWKLQFRIIPYAFVQSGKRYFVEYINR